MGFYPLWSGFPMRSNRSFAGNASSRPPAVVRLRRLCPAQVFGSTVFQTLVLGLPKAEVMGVIGVLALAANLASVLFLLPYKDGDANVRSVWLCSRNDAIGNVIVMFAALGVWGTATAWPDLAVAAVMAAIFLTSSVQILRQAWAEYRTELHQAQPEVS